VTRSEARGLKGLVEEVPFRC